MSKSIGRKVIKAPDVLLQELEGEAVLLNLANGQYYGLDMTGFRMYEVLTSSDSVEEAFEALLLEYEISPEQLKIDLETFLNHLLENGLILEVDDKAG